MEATSSRERVTRHTNEEVNRQIQRDIDSRLEYFAAHPDQIDDRLGELDREWDIERAIQANAASLALTGLFFSLFRRRWVLLPGAVLGFLLQHAIQGWCPPVPVLRRFGFRTQHEIEAERYGLRILRGDFDEMRAHGASRTGQSAEDLLRSPLEERAPESIEH